MHTLPMYKYIYICILDYNTNFNIYKLGLILYLQKQKKIHV